MVLRIGMKVVVDNNGSLGNRSKTMSLRRDYSISRVINGGWQLAGGHGPIDRSCAIEDFEKFFFAGVNTFDCADIYDGVETMLGEFVANIRKRYGDEIARQIKIHTKFVPDFNELSTCDEIYVERIIDRSLSRLKVEQLHLVQFFWWDLSIGSPVTVMSSLKRLQEKGKILHLGITNWDAADVELFVDAGMEIVSAQVQYSVLDQRPKKNLIAWCEKNDAKLLCYGTLAGGFLNESWLGVPDPGFTFENRSLIKYRLIIDEFGGWGLFQNLLLNLEKCAKKHRCSISAIATRYVLEQPQVAAAIIGSRSADRLTDTLSVYDFELDSEDHALIEIILNESKGPNGPVYGLESDREGRHGSIMKYNQSNL